MIWGDRGGNEHYKRQIQSTLHLSACVGALDDVPGGAGGCSRPLLCHCLLQGELEVNEWRESIVLCLKLASREHSSLRKHHILTE